MRDKRLEHMREDYTQIEIPKELRGKVEGAMARAKKEQKEEKIVAYERSGRDGKKGPRRKAAVWITRAAGAVVAAMLVVTVLANTSADVAYAMEKIPVLGAFVKVVTFRSYERNDNNMEADIKVPEVRVENAEGEVLEETTEDLNRKIQEYTDALIAMYEADVEAAGGEGHESVELDYSVVTDNDKLFSIRFNQLIIMASGSESIRIYHVDKATGQVITLAGLFQDDADYVTAISENIKEQMKARMAEDENKIYWVDSIDMPELNFQQIREDATFYVNETGRLVIVFDEYEVAPGYMGYQEFEIPTEVVEDIVKEGYLEP